MPNSTKRGLTPKTTAAAMQLLRRSIGVFMRAIVDQALQTYEFAGEIDSAQLAQSREKVVRYIEKLVSAGQKDTHQLTEYARAYLKEIHEGRDPQFSGC
jgi:hypothetical protein